MESIAKGTKKKKKMEKNPTILSDEFLRGITKTFLRVQSIMISSLQLLQQFPLTLITQCD